MESATLTVKAIVKPKDDARIEYSMVREIDGIGEVVRLPKVTRFLAGDELTLTYTFEVSLGYEELN